MIPLFGEIASKDKFDQIIANEAGVAIEDIISTDLFLYNSGHSSHYKPLSVYLPNG